MSFKLVPQDVPSRKRQTIYSDIVESFMESGKESVLVSMDEEIKTPTLVQGLRKASAEKDVRVLTRNNEVYLSRK